MELKKQFPLFDNTSEFISDWKWEWEWLVRLKTKNESNQLVNHSWLIQNLI